MKDKIKAYGYYDEISRDYGENFTDEQREKIRKELIEEYNRYTFPYEKKSLIIKYQDYIKNHNFKSEFIREARKFWTPAFEKHILSIYRNSLRNPIAKPFDIRFVSHIDFSKRVESNEFFNNFLMSTWLSDDRNIMTLKNLCDKELKQRFPDALKGYGIPDDYRYTDIPKEETLKDREFFVFTHSDKYLRAITEMPKIPLSDWETTYANSFHTIQTKKVVFRIGDECLLGEFKRNINYSNDDYINNSGSGVKFYVYIKGQRKGKFLVSRWDYEPLGIHFNKFNHRGDFDINGFYCNKTRHSHVHYYNLKQRLFFTQNQSPDVSPTPINCNSEKAERVYRSIFEMSDDFEYQNFCMEVPPPQFSQDCYLKEFIIQNCPFNYEYAYSYDKQINRILTKTPKNFEYKFGNNENILNDNKEQICQDAEAQFGV